MYNLNGILGYKRCSSFLDNRREVNLHLTCEAIVSMIYGSFLTLYSVTFQDIGGFFASVCLILWKKLALEL